jgi:hypothetical protein
VLPASAARDEALPRRRRADSNRCPRQTVRLRGLCPDTRCRRSVDLARGTIARARRPAARPSRRSARGSAGVDPSYDVRRARGRLDAVVGAVSAGGTGPTFGCLNAVHASDAPARKSRSVSGRLVDSCAEKHGWRVTGRARAWEFPAGAP